MTLALKLTHDEPKLVFLALVYHLATPGSEIDAATHQPRERGLRGIKVALGGRLAEPEAVVELDDEQYRRLLAAIHGSVNELRVHHMSAGAASTFAGFTETARSLFPRLADDPEEALTIAEAMVMLHRRIERAVARAAEASPGEAPPGRRRRRWPFRRGP